MELPDHWRIHNAFHVSLLMKYQGPEPSEMVLEDPPEVEELEEILQPKQSVPYCTQGPEGRKEIQISCKI